MRALLLALFAASCNPTPPPEPAPKDWSQAHASLLERLPGDAMVLSVADFGHLLERLSAMRRLVTAAPNAALKLQPIFAQMKEKVGFDVLDPKAWEAEGLAPGSPAAFLFDADHPWLIFKAADAGKLSAMLEKQLGSLKCTADGAWLACGDPGRTPPRAADKASSSWARITASMPLEAQKMDLLGFAPLEKVSADSKMEFLRASKAAWNAIRMDEREVRMRFGYDNPELKGIEKYLKQESGTASLLGAARGAEGAGRFTYSPSALWAMAKEKIPPKELNQVVGGFAMVTGLDLEKDLIGNLTGEMVTVTTRAGMAVYLGTRDEARTKLLLEKLDALTSGLSQMFKPESGIKFEHEVDELRGTKFYHYKFAMDAERFKLPAPLDYEFHYASAKGAIVFGMERTSVDLGSGLLGKSPQGFLDELPASVRARYNPDAVAWGYMRSVDPSRWMSSKMMAMAKVTYDKINPALWPILLEVMNTWELIWDGDTLMTCKDGRVELDYLLRLL